VHWRKGRWALGEGPLVQRIWLPPSDQGVSPHRTYNLRKRVCTNIRADSCAKEVTSPLEMVPLCFPISDQPLLIDLFDRNGR
jgi:hypothetical protein